ncbi:copper homeostasis protein CutC [Agromyces protaetiae]|uniref:PF03932 family protein CutC n=1 Tax=Agromyces protaetiae TaxID=2509455 RepID=A0A4V0YH72_9MICO|nr:copper homeostasis protein CutC [Agromyces protaetiae]QAY73701.1 copper homeostasis protein CutC [Agromyces protaetiae]
MPTAFPIEIAVQDAAGVGIALEGGAARVEVCQALALGGLTPSAGLIEAAAEAADAHGASGFVHVLVRPRGGGFVYDADEVAATVRDIRLAARLGADGVVVGALTDASTLDLEAITAFIDAAGDLDVTVHRAVDASADPVASVTALAAFTGAGSRGVRRVLTSGGAPDCRSGLAGIAAMRAAVGDALELMSGGGVRVEDIALLVGAGVDAVHLSARTSVVRGKGGPGGGVDAFDATDASLVRAAVDAARSAAASR